MCAAWAANTGGGGAGNNGNNDNAIRSMEEGRYIDKIKSQRIGAVVGETVSYQFQCIELPPVSYIDIRCTTEIETQFEMEMCMYCIVCVCCVYACIECRR